MTYQEQLLCDEWKNKRNYIVNRDQFSCKKCINENLLSKYTVGYLIPYSRSYSKLRRDFVLSIGYNLDSFTITSYWVPSHLLLDDKNNFIVYSNEYYNNGYSVSMC